ncbi:MAG TPA: 3-phosphoglycerate dehydrogenase [Kiloniellaceae bacterium]|nr:3-phosphoglycerate dehydrogenase [Kiloniellaceae bacterium]
MPKVLFVGDIHPDGHRLFDSRPEFERVLFKDPKPADLLEVIPEAEAIVLRKLHLGSETLAKAERLKMVSRHGVGYDNVDVDHLTRFGIPLLTVGDANAASVAEHAMMMILAAARRLPACMELVRTAEGGAGREEFLVARDEVGTMELANKSILIVGFGRVGRRLAKLASAFDMKVVVADPFVEPRLPESFGFRHVGGFEEAMEAVDCIVLCLPAKAGDAPLFGKSQFARMKKGALFVNVARGSLVDEGALADAVEQGHLLSAGTDVWHELPPGPDHRFMSLPNMIVTPHCAAHTDACLSRMAVISVQNVFDFFDGKAKRELCVNPEAINTVGI